MSWSRKSRAVAVIALLVATGTGMAAPQEETGGPGNRAHLDVPETEDVVDTAKTIVADLFTYEYSAMNAHRGRFSDLTTGDLQEEYDELFGEVVRAAEAQQLVVESEAVDAAVRLLKDDEAEVLVFLDQNTTSAAQNTPATYKAMVLVTFTNTDGGWKASGVETFEVK